MIKPMLIAKNSQGLEFSLLARMTNRHGLVAGATGTGKTVTLQKLAEALSENGVPVFLSDVKGDLSGISQRGAENPKIMDRIKLLDLSGHTFREFPVTFWDVFGKSGHPIRVTVSDMGPLLMSRLLNLNEVQAGVLALIFKIADDNGLLLLDLKDLRSMIQYVGDNAQKFTTEYGNVSKSSVGAIQRGLLELEAQGADQFFGEPMLDIFDFIQTHSDGRGMINILAADQLISRPKVYATFLLWLLSELFERLPEVGDLDKPKLVFFFDEAHLLFQDAPEALLEKIEQVVRLIRSKGVGVYFVTQNPRDIPDKVLAQLGNRLQHALRAFTPLEQKAVKIMAQTFRPNPKLDIEQVITELGVGEALVSFLQENGAPAPVERAFICPPQSRLGTITDQERQKIVQGWLHFGKYEKAVDRESAFEILKKRSAQKLAEVEPVAKKPTNIRRAPGRPRDSLGQVLVKSTLRTIGSSLGRRILRGILGSILGNKK
ncbi:MAG TPA: DUF853 family protein [Candidatus Omnitrophota bacterium]|nr:DUF853 family protein [Candidatus Omnitrophota bacterium]